MIKVGVVKLQARYPSTWYRPDSLTGNKAKSYSNESVNKRTHLPKNKADIRQSLWPLVDVSCCLALKLKQNESKSKSNKETYTYQVLMMMLATKINKEMGNGDQVCQKCWCVFIASQDKLKYMKKYSQISKNQK